MSECFAPFFDLQLCESRVQPVKKREGFFLFGREAEERDDDDDGGGDDMGIATPPFASVTSHPSSKGGHHLIPSSSVSINKADTYTFNSMSQDYNNHHHHQSIFSFPNGFERSQQEEQLQQHHQHHMAQQIRRDKLRVQGGFEAAGPPNPLVVGLGEEEESSSTVGLPGGYESAGMLSELFNFPSGGAATSATELLESQISQSYRATARGAPSVVAATGVGVDWYGQQRHNISVGGGLGPLGGDDDNKNHNVVNERDTIAAAAAAAHHHHHQQHQISNINAESAAAAMQLFLMNPQPRSPSSPSPSSHPPPHTTSSTLHMLLPNPTSTTTLHHHHQGFHHQNTSSASAPFGGPSSSQFTWGIHHQDNSETDPHQGAGISREGQGQGQGLSLSLSSSLQHLEAAKAEELRMGDGAGAMLFFNQAPGGPSANSSQFGFKNLGGGGHQQYHQGGVGFGSSTSSTSIGMVNVLRNSRYAKAAQELLEEFCSVGRGHLMKKNKLTRQNTNLSSNQSNNNSSVNNNNNAGGATSSSKEQHTPLSAADRIEHQRRKVKLLTMLDEVDRRYNHYCEQMHMVVNSFDLVMGFGAAVPYTALAQKAMSRHFRCLKDAITAQLKHSCELLGEKDAGTSGLTKGETPRLKLLEQSLRQQRAFHQMGMMDQEAWRPQRGLPERSVNILRAWLFEHFLHPYPSDADKHLLARQTGLSRNQVSNWFINARVRLWKPMVEDMYQQEAKEEETMTTTDEIENTTLNSGLNHAQTSTPPNYSYDNTTTTTTATSTAAATSASHMTAGKRSDFNAPESDPSLIAINNRQCSSENQAKQLQQQQAMMINPSSANIPTPTPLINPANSTAGITQSSFPVNFASAGDDPEDDEIAGSTLIKFGASTGDVSLTLGLRHAGNLPEHNPFFS